MRTLVILVLFSSYLFSVEKNDELLTRIETHFLIGDPYSALQEAEEGLKKDPENKEITKAFLKALAECDYDSKSIKLLNSMPDNLKDLKTDSKLLEDISWAVLRKGLNSTQYATRLSSMIGIYLTRDAKAVNVINDTLRDTNAILRSVAVQLSISYRDDLLKESISYLLENEKVWLVRLEVLKAVGQMKIKDNAEILKRDIKK